MAVVVPDLPDLFEESYLRAGSVMRTGNDLRNIRRSFNILTIEWQNRGLNLWTITSGTLSLTSGTATYTTKRKEHTGQAYTNICTKTI